MPPSSRIPAMDVLRGCAVMGILWMNITAFAQPQSAYINPAAAGPLTTGDIAFWAISLILVDGKMRGLFRSNAAPLLVHFILLSNRNLVSRWAQPDQTAIFRTYLHRFLLPPQPTCHSCVPSPARP